MDTRVYKAVSLEDWRLRAITERVYLFLEREALQHQLEQRS